MNRRSTRFWIALACCAMALVALGRVPAVADPFLVQFQPNVPEPARQGLLNRFQAAVQCDVPLVGAKSVDLPAPAAAALARHAWVRRVEPDFLVEALGKPAPPPPPAPAQVVPWGIGYGGDPAVPDRSIHADQVWATGITGRAVNVAVLDTGIDLTHPDLAANIKGGRNFMSSLPKNAGKYADDNGHGTHVAGSIAAVNNTIGVVGVAPNASLWALKVLDRNGVGPVSGIINAIGWCVATRGDDGDPSNDVHVINMSLGLSQYVAQFEEAVQAALAAGIVQVAAAGNVPYPDHTVSYPAKFPQVIAVAATDGNYLVASSSADGPEVDIAAPGVSVYSTWKGGGYATASGTSMASPHVAGTVALLLEAKPQLPPMILGVPGEPSVYGVLTGTVLYPDGLQRLISPYSSTYVPCQGVFGYLQAKAAVDLAAGL